MFGIKRYHWIWLVPALIACQKKGGSQSISASDFSDTIVQDIHLHKQAHQLAPILPHLQSRSETRRLHAAVALGSFTDSAAVPYLELALKDRSQGVREAAAFAMAQTGSYQAEVALLKAIKAARPELERPVLLEELGRCGRERGLAYLLQLRCLDERDELGRVKGLYRMALQRGTPEIADEMQKLIAESNHEELLYYAMSALLRMKSPLNASLEKRLQALYQRANITELKIRMAEGFSLLSAIADPQFIRHEVLNDTLAPPIKEGWLWMLGKKSEIEATYLPGMWPQLKWYTTQLLWSDAMAKRPKLLIPANCDTAFALRIRMKRMDADRETNALQLLNILNRKQYAEEIRASLIELQGADQSTLYDYYAKNHAVEGEHPMIQNAMYAALLESNKDRNLWIEKGLNSGNMSFLSLAIYALKADSIKEGERIVWIPMLQSLLPMYAHASHWESFLDLKSLLQSWDAWPDGAEYHPERRSLKRQDLAALKNSYLLQMTTPYGKVRLQLDSRHTPLSALAILEACQKNYYHNKTFHRIVPLFVAQGGCPRGDGWGSPDVLLRSELSPLPFNTGAIGIASAGRDTEGLQLFFMHRHAPHLEGRYSRIGVVLQGMENLQQLSTGDRIESLTLLE